MTKEWVEIMKQTKRLKLSRWHSLTHFFIVPFVLIPPSFDIYGLIANQINQPNYGVGPVSYITSFTWICITLAIVFYFIQKRGLRFREVKVEYSDSDFQEAVKRSAKEYEWRIELNNKNVFRAYRPWNWTGSWGEMITIIKDKDRLLLNSICDPNLQSSVASFGWNKRNIDKFLSNLEDAQQGIPVEEKVEKPKREWTLFKVLVRLFAYPFCLFLIGFGVYQIINAVDAQSIFFGFLAVVIASVYLFSDLKLILRNGNSNS